MTADGKVRKCAIWLLAVAIPSQFYFIQELLAAFALFAIAFGALAFVVLSLYLLQKGWEIAVVRIFDGERWMAGDAPAAMLWVAGQDSAESKPAEELKTENRNSKDWNGKEILNWVDGEKCAERI